MKKMKITDLKPYNRNAKIHTPKQIEKIKKSIQEYGFLVPIVVDEDNNILMGHGRRLALIELGIDEVDVIVKSGLNDEQKKALRIADNKVSESEYDIDALLREIEEIEYSFTGFEQQELDILFVDSDIFNKEEEQKQVEDICLPDMERRLNEHHDYIVFVFDNIEDFVRVATYFKITKVNESLTRKRKTKVGIGRVLDAGRILDLIEKVSK